MLIQQINSYIYIIPTVYFDHLRYARYKTLAVVHRTR
jgi:hypothetical protein